MKKILLSAMFFSLLVCGNAQENSKINDAKLYYGLKGSVKKTETIYCAAIEKFGKAKKAQCHWGRGVVFNKDGQELTIVNSSGDGKLKSKFIVTYNADGHPVGGESFDAQGKRTSINKSVLSEDGKVEKIKVYNDSDSLKQTVEFEYDNMGNRTSVTVKDANGNIKSKQVRKYNDFHKPIEEKFYNKNGQLTLEAKLQYGKEGDVIKRRSFIDYKYKYDQKGNWVQKIEYHSGKIYSMWERKIQYY